MIDFDKNQTTKCDSIVAYGFRFMVKDSSNGKIITVLVEEFRV